MRSDSYVVTYPGGEILSGSYRVWKESAGIYYYRGDAGDLALSFDPIYVVLADKKRAWRMLRSEWSEYFVNKLQPIITKKEPHDPGVVFVGFADVKLMTFGFPEWGRKKLWGDENCMSSCSAEAFVIGTGDCGLEISDGMIYSIGDQDVNVEFNDSCGCVQVLINDAPPPYSALDGELLDINFIFNCDLVGIEGPECVNVVELSAVMLDNNKIGFSIS